MPIYHRKAGKSMLTILKHFLLTGIDGRKAIRRIAQPQPEGLRSSGIGAAPQSPQKNHSFCGSGMDGFSHLYYRCIACQYYTKLGIIVASNAYGAPYAKPLVSTEVEVRGFCLLRLCPNPRRTQFCVLKNPAATRFCKSLNGHQRPSFSDSLATVRELSPRIRSTFAFAV